MNFPLIFFPVDENIIQSTLDFSLAGIPFLVIHGRLNPATTDNPNYFNAFAPCGWQGKGQT